LGKSDERIISATSQIPVGLKMFELRRTSIAAYHQCVG